MSQMKEQYKYSKKQKEKKTGLFLKAHIEIAKQISIPKKESKTCPFLIFYKIMIFTVTILNLL